ncbi:MAG: hypothetical protein QM627_02050 [Luteolibacter sp.]
MLSKLLIAALLGLFGTFVILGVKNLGHQLDQQLNDSEVLAVIVTETVNTQQAPGMLMPGVMEVEPWKALSRELVIYYQSGGLAEIENGRRTVAWAIDDLAHHQLDDDFYLLSDQMKKGATLEFEINGQRSQAIVHSHTPDTALILQGRETIVGGVERLSPVLASGFSRVLLIRAKSVREVQKAHDIVDALSSVEGRQVQIQSNLRVLRDLERVRNIQAQALVWVTVGSSLVLGLVFGSLAWMEFREERYLLSLIRTFGVGRVTLLVHALIEHCLLSIGGVLLGIGILQTFISRVDLKTLRMDWLMSGSILQSTEGHLLLWGALAGGVLACVPIAIGLRKPLGLVLK